MRLDSRRLSGTAPRRVRTVGKAVLAAAVSGFFSPPVAMAQDAGRQVIEPAVTPKARAVVEAADRLKVIPPVTPKARAERGAASRESVRDAAAESTPPPERARRSYLGRVVAQPMSYHGANWLVRDNRDQEENVRVAYQQLRLAPGMTVCDLGCGNGFWSLPMAKSVGDSGRVLAVDIQPEMLQLLRRRGAKSGVKNVAPILGKIDNPNLPAGSVDLLLMVDVYHEFSHPESMLWWIRRSLTPRGVVALLEYRQEDPKVPIKPLHKMSKRQIMKEYESNGFKLVREYNDLPWQHLMFFARDDSPVEAVEPVPGLETVKSRSGGESR